MASSTNGVNGAHASSGVDYEALVVGTGFGGIRMLYELGKRGVSAKAFEAGTECRRYLVLESISWRQNRFRELGIHLDIPGRDWHGVDVERTFPDPARSGEVSQRYYRPLQPSQTD